MALEPLDLSLWVTQIRAQLSTTEAKEVALATSRTVVEQFGKAAPAVYVLRAQGVASNPGDAAGASVQWVDAYVEVLLVASRYADPMGANAVDALRTLRIAVWDALIGWRPSDAALSISLDRYSDGDPSQSVLYGVDRFRTSYQIRKL